MRCPVCDERIRSRAKKCKHCLTIFDDDPDQRNYLEQAFRKIDYELSEFESKIERIIGLIFKRHEYSPNELQNSPHIARIESITGKIRDDIANWSAHGMLSLKTRTTYNNLAESTHQQLDTLIERINTRKSTHFEVVSQFLCSFGKFLRTTLLPMLKDTICITSSKLKRLPESDIRYHPDVSHSNV